MHSLYHIFCLESLQIYAVFFSFLYASVIVISFWGLARDFIKFCKLFIILPYIFFLASYLFPQIILQFLFLGLILNGLILFLKSKKPKISLSNYNIIALLYLGAWYLKSTLPHAIIDPMIYHLNAGKNWSLFQGNAYFNPQTLQDFFTSYFEYFYYMIILVFKYPLLHLKKLPQTYFENTLYILLLTAQLIHGFVAYVLVPGLLLRFFKFNKLQWLMSLFLLYGLKNFTWTWPAAKNDCIPFFGFLLSLIVQNSFITGISIGVKYSNILALLGMISFKKKKIQLVSIIGIFCGILPIFIRNYLGPHNPFYPNPSSFFPNLYINEDGMNYLKPFLSSANFTQAYQKLLTLLKEEYALTLFLLVAIYFKQTRKKAIIFLLLVFFISKITGPPLEWRLFSFLLIYPLFIIPDFFIVINSLHIIKKRIIMISMGSIIILASQFSIENYIKMPKKWLTKTSLETIRIEFPIDPILEYNQKNLNNPNHKAKSFGQNYFLRFPFISEISNKVY